MSETVIIVGAGLAGLLAANMLRRSRVAILEHQKDLPNNHHAVLRFRTNKVALQTGIPFKPVQVFKAVHGAINPVSDALAYSYKVSGCLEMRSIISTEPGQRWIAPPDLVQQMAHGLDIKYGVNFNKESVDALRGEGIPVISTMPMPNLMDILGYTGKRPAFIHRPGTVMTARLSNCDVYATIYFPHSMAPYRASITGDRLIIESVAEMDPNNAFPILLSVMNAFGLTGESLDRENPPEIKQTAYAKLARLSAEDRKRAHDFLFWATTQHGIFSLGRFATWRAGLLLDDLVDDVAKIEGWMRGGFPYQALRDTF